MLIIHHNDLDGRAAAAIALRDIIAQGIPAANIHLREIDYKDENDFSALSPFDLVLILDFHLTPADLEVLCARVGQVVQIDHHKSTPELYRGWTPPPNLDMIWDQSACGALLTWRYCYQQSRPVPHWLTLVDDHDRYIHQFPETRDFTAGLANYDTAPGSALWDNLRQSAYLDEVQSLGHTVRQGMNQRNEEACRSYGFPCLFNAMHCFALNKRGNSDTFGARMDEYPICILFYWDGTKWTVSLYSKTVDVAQIARKFSYQGRQGGGHKGAAGFCCDKLPFSGDLRLAPIPVAP